jgi:DNA-binding MarR family transcriptional regulator
VKIVDYHLQELFNGHGIDLTKEQMIVLKRLHDRDGINQNELAFLTLRNKSSLTRLLNNMQKKKYITRKQSSVDKRVNHIFLTDLGKEIFKRSRPVIKEVLNTMQQNISENEKKQIIEILKKIQINFDENVQSL